MRVNTGIFLCNKVAQLTRKFEPILYLGNPRNSIEIFSAMDYDELCVFNSKVNINDEEIKYLRWIANGSKSPIMYSGGIKSLENAKKIIEIGYEKICLQSHFLEIPESAQEIANCIGKQSNNLILDCYFDESNKKWSTKKLIDLKFYLLNNQNIITNLFGELIINSITHNGLFNITHEALSELKKCTECLQGINLGYCGGIATANDIQILKNLNYDACYIFSAATLSFDRNSKMLNSHVLRNLR
jgi:cyclase